MVSITTYLYELKIYDIEIDINFIMQSEAKILNKCTFDHVRQLYYAMIINLQLLFNQFLKEKKQKQN